MSASPLIVAASTSLPLRRSYALPLPSGEFVQDSARETKGGLQLPTETAPMDALGRGSGICPLCAASVRQQSVTEHWRKTTQDGCGPVRAHKEVGRPVRARARDMLTARNTRKHM